MSTGTVGHVLNRVILFEKRLQNAYVGVRDRCADHGARLLSYYLSRHRRQVDRSCQRIDSRTLERIKGTELPSDIVFSPDSIEPLLSAEPRDITDKQLLDTAVAYHKLLNELCQSILRQRLRPEATAFFEDLEDLQEREVTTLEKMRSIDYF